MHDLDSILDQDWSKCHINEKAITFNEIAYRAHCVRANTTKSVKAYFWFNRKTFEIVSDESQTQEELDRW